MPTVYIEIEKASFNILLTKLFQNQTIIVPSLNIKQPYVYISRSKKNEWNFSDLIKTPYKHNNLKDWNLIVGRIILENGAINFIDQTFTPTFYESIKNINLSAAIMPLEKTVKFNLETHLPNRQAAFISSGIYHFSSKELATQNSLSNLPLAEYLKLFHLKNAVSLNKGTLSASELKITYKNSIIDAAGDVALNSLVLLIGSRGKIEGNLQSPNIKLTWDKKQLSGKGSIKLSESIITFAPEKNLQGYISVDVDTFTASPKNLTADGNIEIKKAILTLKNKIFKGDTIINSTSLSQKNNIFHWAGGLNIKQANFNLENNNSFQGNIIVKNSSVVFSEKKLNIKGAIETTQATIQFNKDKKIFGNPDLNFTYQQTPGQPIHYSGTLFFKDATLSGVPLIEDVSKINGKITFQPDNIKTDQLDLYLQQTDFKLSGTLTNFTEPELNLKAKTQKMDLIQLLHLVPSSFQKKIPAVLTGQASIEASYIGSASTPENADIKISTHLMDTSISWEKFPKKITNISGDISYQKDLVSWTNLQGVYRNDTYTLNGKVDSFSRPILTTELMSKQTNLFTKINILRSAFRVVELEGKAFNSSFNITGDVHFFNDAAPDLDFKGDLTLKLEDILPLIPDSLNSKKEKITNLNPKGIISGNALFRGKLHKWRDWLLVFDVSSPQITINNYPFQDTSIQFVQRDNHISEFDINTKLYGGALSAFSTWNLLQKNIPGKLNLNLEKLDLSLWRKDKKIKNRNLAGDLSVNLEITGPAKSLKKIKGTGIFSITNGYLGRIIKLYPNAFFTDARADFIIQNLKAITENAELFSQVVDLSVAGWIDLNKELYFDIVPQVGKISFSKKENLSIDPSFLLREAVSLTCSGTIAEPQCAPNASPIKVLENTTDFILEGVGSIFEELF